MHAMLEAPNAAAVRDAVQRRAARRSSAHEEAAASESAAAADVSFPVAPGGDSATRPRPPGEERPMTDGGLFTMHLADPHSSAAAASAAAAAGEGGAAGTRMGGRRRMGGGNAAAALGPPLRGRLWVKHQVAAHNLQASMGRLLLSTLMFAG